MALNKMLDRIKCLNEFNFSLFYEIMSQNIAKIFENRCAMGRRTLIVELEHVAVWFQLV